MKSSEFAEGDGQLGFDGLDGKIEETGDVFVFEAVFFDEGEDQFTARGQLVDGGPEPLQDLGAKENGFGVGFEADVGVAAFAEFDGGRVGGIAKVVERAIFDGDIQVDFRVGDGAYRFLPETYEDIVNYFFGCFFLMGDRIGKAEQAYEIRLVERFKSRSFGVLLGITD